MARNVADLVRKFREAADELPPTLGEQVRAGAARTKVIYLAGASSAGLTPGQRMRGVGRNGAAWGVKYKVKESQGGNQFAVVEFFGPVHLVNNDTAPHIIESKRQRAARRAQARVVIQALTQQRVRRSRARAGSSAALKIGDGFATEVNHPGTTGKNFFRPADTFARSEVTRIIQRTHKNTLSKARFGR